VVIGRDGRWKVGVLVAQDGYISGARDVAEAGTDVAVQMVMAMVGFGERFRGSISSHQD
jgi:hypothetical protein